MITWVKPSGIEIATNDLDATIEYCKSLGWKKAGEEKKESKKKAKSK